MLIMKGAFAKWDGPGLLRNGLHSHILGQTSLIRSAQSQFLEASKDF